MPKKIPYAVANFTELREKDYYFVDKTRYIRELEKYKVPVFLRPRRFGKSLWCSILECYYDVNRAERFARLFGTLDIGREPTPEHNRYLVMRFDFSTIEVKPDYAQMEILFRSHVNREIASAGTVRYRHLLPGFTMPETNSCADALAALLKHVQDQQAPPLYIIIDEYDNFTNQLITSHQDHLYEELTTGDSFLRTFFKVIKSGIGDGSIGHVFITGVLPITMDDLTSGFNIAEIITLKPQALAMMGFTQSEVDRYVDEIFADQGFPVALREPVRDTIRTHYNGYRLLPEATDTLYNSTILNFYLADFVRSGGILPTEMIDDNLRVDVNWLRRLTGSDTAARELVEQLMFDGAMPVDTTMLRAKFNMRQFFEKEFYPLSLYYLGMLTFQDRYTLAFPNLTGKTIFTEYFNELSHISVSLGYTDLFTAFLQNPRLEDLFSGYWQRYVGQIPAQAFDKVNENFYRTTFYEICNRYLSYYFAFSIEVNHPSGRSDWEAQGRERGPFADECYLVEFKHFPLAEGKKLGVLKWREPCPEDVTQIDGYAADLHAKYPTLRIQRHLLYTVGHLGYRWFTLP